MARMWKRITAGIMAGILCCSVSAVVSTPEDSVLVSVALEDITQDGVVYRVYGNYAVVVDLDGTQESLVIAENVNGVPVTRINSLNTGGKENIKEIIIPKTVQFIQEYAFAHCTALERVYFTGSERLWKTVKIGEPSFYRLDAEVIFGEEDDEDADICLELYFQSDYEDLLSMPDELATSYQIPLTDPKTADIRIVSGDSAGVSSDGLIRPTNDSSFGSETGETIIRVQEGEAVTYYRVNVYNYVDYYVWEHIDAYMAEHITDDMTTEEKLDAICAYPASFDYSPYYSNYRGMILSGGGDCWASTSLIIMVCKKLGINAKVRNGNRDPGAGNGHINALAEVDGEYYELEAGYSGKAPRPYDVVKRDSLFCFKSVEGGYEVYQYDGWEQDKTELTVPDSYRGVAVVGIGSQFLLQNQAFEKVALPDTITYIGQSAFNSATALKEIIIPAGVTSIGDFAFTYCTALENFSCAPDNPAFTVIDGVLYDKDVTTVLSVPYVSEVVLPDTVTDVAGYSFYYNQQLTKVILPEGLKTIGEGAFGDCSALESLEIPASVETIDEFAFYSMTNLKRIVFNGKNTVLADSEKTIDKHAEIYGLADSTAEAYAEKYNRTFYPVSSIEQPLVTLGDVSCDGKVNALDLSILKFYLLTEKQMQPQQQLNGDINGDEMISVADAILLVRYLLAE